MSLTQTEREMLGSFTDQGPERQIYADNLCALVESIVADRLAQCDALCARSPLCSRVGAA